MRAMTAAAIVCLLFMAGCAQCGLRIQYDGDLRNIPAAYNFRPGVKCAF
jgi:hypothetical protein